MSEYSPWAALASAIIITALKDVKKQNGYAVEALEFLNSPGCYDLLITLDLCPDCLPSVIGRLPDLNIKAVKFR